MISFIYRLLQRSLLLFKFYKPNQQIDICFQKMKIFNALVCGRKAGKVAEQLKIKAKTSKLQLKWHLGTDFDNI